ncbi:MAG: hypothetical protein JWQ76_5338 [Ramlibacter sp.]|nr:hypothetical protein [Ramlibacter sp.]
MTDGFAASIHARLLANAKARGDEFQMVLTRYGLERFLYRLSQSPAREAFWLKGAMLFDLWFDTPHRPTRDADFLGLGPADANALRSAVEAVCAVPANDGMSFDARTIRITETREDARYGGLRVTLHGHLGRARCPVQLDVGYGDAVTPGADDATYPTILEDLPAPSLRVYPRASVMAEKLEAIVSLGMANSRMKDYFDLLALAREGAVRPALLTEALVATLGRRRTPLPEGLPLGLADDFAREPGKQRQWSAFLGKNRLEAPGLDVVLSELRGFLQAPLAEAVARLREAR